MAQTGYTPIQLYYSSTTTNAPLAANVAYGELAINITDGKLFYKDNANAIQVIAWKVTPTSAGGTGLTSYTAGDLTYFASGTALTKLAIGTADYVMTSSGTAPQWSASLKAKAGGTGQTSYAVGDLLYADTTTTLAKLPDIATGNALISGGVSTAPSWGKIGLTTHVSGVLPVANGGTNASTASITSFNNITGYTASGATGTTSTNLVFSTSPVITTPTINSTGSQVAIYNGYQSSVQNNGYQYDGRNYVTATSGTLTKFASVTVSDSTAMGRILIDVIASNIDANAGYAIARSQRVVLFSKFGGTVTILNSTEQYNQIGSVNAGVIAIALVTSAVVNGSNIDLKATATATGAVGATNLAITSQVTVITGSFSNTLTMV